MAWQVSSDSTPANSEAMAVALRAPTLLRSTSRRAIARVAAPRGGERFEIAMAMASINQVPSSRETPLSITKALPVDEVLVDAPATPDAPLPFEEYTLVPAPALFPGNWLLSGDVLTILPRRAARAALFPEAPVFFEGFGASLFPGSSVFINPTVRDLTSCQGSALLSGTSHLGFRAAGQVARGASPGTRDAGPRCRSRVRISLDSV